jgi:CubicO group peptidase (beta-lactamase class C family)
MNRKIPVLASLCLAALVAAGAATRLAAVPAPPAVSAKIAGHSDIAALFDDAALMGETRALLILRDGQPIFERYGPGFGPDSKLVSWSMAKSITAVITGFLVSEGRLALDEPAPVPAWQRPGDPRGAITLRHLLHMSSGLDHVEEGDPAWESDTVAMLFGGGAADMAAFAEAKPPAAAPNEVYEYSSATSVILSDILTDALTTSQNPDARRDAMLDYIRGRLTEPLGMTSLTPEFDAAGTMIGGSIMHATARDYAKFGEFLRNRGVVGGQRLLPDAWIAFMLTGADTDPGYGGHIWLNRPRPAGSGVALWPQNGPNDLFACIGHQGQYIIVSPSQRLTIVRLGISRDDQIPNVRDALMRVAAAN